MAHSSFPKGCRIGYPGASVGCSMNVPANALMGRQMRRWLERQDRKARRNAGLPLIDRKGKANKGGAK